RSSPSRRSRPARWWWCRVWQSGGSWSRSRRSRVLTALIGGLIGVVGERHVLVEPAAQQGFLRDFSWYSPVLADAFVDTRIDAVVQPATLAELAELVALGVRHRAPMTVRGAGTGNYGQSVPLYGGILIDMRRLNRSVSLGEVSVEVEAGAVWEDVEVAARSVGRELRIMPTTYHVATVAGFLAGGSGGLGAVTYGRTWDNHNFASVELLSAEDPPRTLRLEGDDLRNVLHTYGTVGIVTRLRLPLVAAHSWQGWYATFESFDACYELGWELSDDEAVRKRLVSVHEAPIPSMFEPVKRLFTSDPRDIDAVIAFCEQIGVQVANPHSYVVKEGGMVKDIAAVVAFKARTDPFGLLNPGKLDGTFYAGAVNR